MTLPLASAVAAAEVAATRSRNDSLSAPPQIAAISAAIWAYFQQETRALVARGAATDERLALASNAATVMHRLTSLGIPTLGAIEILEMTSPSGFAPTTWVLAPGFQMADPRYAVRVSALEGALAKHHPDVWGALLKAREMQAARAVAHDAAQAASRAEAVRRAPAELLARLVNAGVALDVDRAGSIVAPAGASLTAMDREQLARFKPEVVGLLKVAATARADAARPVVIA